MLDQTFTTENFRKIYDRANRRGLNLEARFFPALAGLTDDIRTLTGQVRELRRENHRRDDPGVRGQIAALLANRDALKAQKNEAIDAELELLAATVRSDSFDVTLRQAIGPGAKAIYPAEDVPGNFFVLKQLQENLKRLYGVKQANRHHIVCQVRDSIDNGFKWTLVRTDISSFYESIDRQRLLSKITSDQLLSVPSKRQIQRILQEYHRLSGAAVGLPRGVGVSAYLSELFMRELDAKLRGLKGGVLYARYVDDIVVLFSRTLTDEHAAYEGLVRAAIEEYGLTPNPLKTHAYNIDHSGALSFEYLGYRFDVAGKRCAVHVGSTRLTRYRKRLELCFAEFARRKPLEPKAARNLLVARVKFLTGNLRLHNSKRHALTGIFYNNSAISDTSSLQGLDAYKSHLAAQTGIPSLQARLADFSFVRGFEERRFQTFSPKALNRIVKVWQHEAA
ncbi:MAG: antiviral reverse transcriptase Drt3a [Phenylobacterium sp.]|uniref:antiviral reverse transcriptase Drt3a n=1 Tax=Phenylobacterium sp. TaxID=1871053 RepID=UPI002733F38E|nr:antiviral reverse transcriptase Drt3a [Phenylobacterium sp.]MDP3749711.1 antiviral reverse transcriptase Drt3a [Phenylobacterium sp.]